MKKTLSFCLLLITATSSPLIGDNNNIAPQEFSNLCIDAAKSSCAIYKNLEPGPEALVGSGVVVSGVADGKRRFAILTANHVLGILMQQVPKGSYHIGFLAKDGDGIIKQKVDIHEIRWDNEKWNDYDMALGDITDLVDRFELKGCNISSIALDSIGKNCSNDDSAHVSQTICIAKADTYADIQLQDKKSIGVMLSSERMLNYPLEDSGKLWKNSISPKIGPLLKTYVLKPVVHSYGQHAQTNIVHCFRVVTQPGNSGGPMYIVSPDGRFCLLGIVRSGENGVTAMLPIDYAYDVFKSLYKTTPEQRFEK